MADAIHPDGDVVFIVGNKKSRVLVSSVILRNSSQVFNVLLGPKYAEGQKLSSKGSVEVPLPEDDPEALTTILCVLHGRNDRVPEEIPGDKLCEIATLCDKYDLFIPLKFAIQQWLRASWLVSEPSELWLLMSAAYWFRHQKVFAKATHDLIRYHVGSYTTFARRIEIHPDSAALICLSLEEQRSRTTLRILEAFYGLEGDQVKSCSCGWNARYFFQLVNKQGVAWNDIRNQQSSLSQTINWAINVVSPTRINNLSQCYSDASHWQWTEKFATDFRENLVRDATVYKGLCLACIRGDIHTEHGNE